MTDERVREEGGQSERRGEKGQHSNCGSGLCEIERGWAEKMNNKSERTSPQARGESGFHPEREGENLLFSTFAFGPAHQTAHRKLLLPVLRMRIELALSGPLARPTGHLCAVPAVTMARICGPQQKSRIRGQPSPLRCHHMQKKTTHRKSACVLHRTTQQCRSRICT